MNVIFGYKENLGLLWDFFIYYFLFLFSCSNKVTQVYICGDHPCVNKKEMKEYFDNNISIEVFTIISDKENKKSLPWWI